MAAYLDTATFKSLSIAPASYVDAIETDEPGWLAAQLLYWSGWIDARLRKRYDVPFTTPAPLAAQGWLAAIVTERVYRKRGVDPTDEQIATVLEDAATAKAEIKEAADSQVGLFELPLNANDQATAITKTAPLSYFEASPYTWLDVQADDAADE